MISVVVIVRDEAALLRGCLDTVADWARDIVVVDMHSADGSADVAHEYGARVFFQEPLEYVEPARNFALEQARGDWVLVLDPDERVPRSLLQELSACTRRPIDVVQIYFRQVMFDREMASPGASDTYHPRFFRRGVLAWPADVHGVPDLTDLRVCWLPCDDPSLSIRHETWTSIPQVLHKISRYISHETRRPTAGSMRGADLRSALTDAREEFVRRFVDGLAYCEGMPGLLTSLIFAFYRLVIYEQWWYEVGWPARAHGRLLRWARRAHALATALSRLTRLVPPVRAWTTRNGDKRPGPTWIDVLSTRGRIALRGPSEAGSSTPSTTRSPADSVREIGQVFLHDDGAVPPRPFSLLRMLGAPARAIRRGLPVVNLPQEGNIAVINIMNLAVCYMLAYGRRWELDGKPDVDRGVWVLGRTIERLLDVDRALRGTALPLVRRARLAAPSRRRPDLHRGNAEPKP